MNKSSRVSTSILTLIATVVTLACPWALCQQPKAVGIEPVNATAPAENAGLFVGVNQFPNDPSLSELKFAVDDAIAQAHLFCLELRLIEPKNCQLALGGEARGEEAKKQLGELKKAGTKQISAERTSILHCLRDITGAQASGANLLIVSFSSHGFAAGGSPFVMASDSFQSLLADTAIELSRIDGLMADARAGKKILLLDACRNKSIANVKGAAPAMDKAFGDELARAKGQVSLASCRLNQYSYEDDTLGHGVFTYYLLSALRGDAPPDAAGFIRLDNVIHFVSRSVEDWCNRNHRNPIQQPVSTGAPSDGQIPLAIGGAELKRHGSRPATTTPAGNSEADTMYARGESYRIGSGAPEDYSAAMRWYLMAAEKGNSAAMNRLGELYYWGHGVDPDYKTAIGWYERAADRGNADAMLNLANDYWITQQSDLALSWYRKSADTGNANAMFCLGYRYSLGLRVQKDYVEAVKWFQKAAAAGSIEAMNSLGVSFENGWTGHINPDDAMRWYRRAADAGNYVAMRNIARLYWEGNIIPEDKAEAQIWYRRAAAAGDDMAQQWIADHSR